MRRRRLHRATFVAAGVYNILWGCYAVLDPQWFFRLTGIPQSNTPQIFATLGMVLGLYGILYLGVAHAPEDGWLVAAVGLTGKILGPIGLAWLILAHTWPAASLVLVSTNDIIWWVPFALYLHDALPWFRRNLRSRPHVSSSSGTKTSSQVSWRDEGHRWLRTRLIARAQQV